MAVGPAAGKRIIASVRQRGVKHGFHGSVNRDRQQTSGLSLPFTFPVHSPDDVRGSGSKQEVLDERTLKRTLFP